MSRLRTACRFDGVGVIRPSERTSILEAAVTCDYLVLMLDDRFLFYQVKRVFLACPGDLVAERSRFPRLLEAVNNLRAHSLGLHLEPVGWERVIPSFGRPQELINSELRAADLAIVMFWNRIGSPSGNHRGTTGTLEEYDLACKLHEDTERPLVWVYFRKPTATSGEQMAGVVSFRKTLEEGRELFFREYETAEDWEEMLREHLVAYLDGLQRWSIDENLRSMRPEHSLLKGAFLGEGIYAYGGVLRLRADLDGDGHQEEIGFMYSHGGFSLWVRRFDKTYALELPDTVQPDEGGKTPARIHLALKDVTNDGLPELLLATHDGVIDLRVAVYGFTSSEARNAGSLDKFGLLRVLDGQRLAEVREGGTVLLPYGSARLARKCVWTGDQFECADNVLS
jgi:hypothetical protein